MKILQNEKGYEYFFYIYLNFLKYFLYHFLYNLLVCLKHDFFLFSSSFAPPKFSFCFRAVMETRLAWDGECYTRSDFLEWYGEDQGFVIWAKAARAKDVVASAKDVTTSYKAAGAKATEIVDTATVNFVA